MVNHTLDPILLAIEPLVGCRIGVVDVVGEHGFRRLLGQVDPRIVGLAVRRLAGREIESDGAASCITETMNFTGEPTRRVAKSSLMNPFFAHCREMGANRSAVDVVMPRSLPSSRRQR